MVEINRVPIYIEGLDKYLQGGIPEGHILLVSGTAGTMKSSITFNVLYNEAAKGKNSLYLSLEQSSDSLLAHMQNMGYDFTNVTVISLEDISKLDNLIKEMNNDDGNGKIALIDIASIRKQVKAARNADSGNWMNVIRNMLIKIKGKVTLHHFSLDSLSALYNLADLKNPRTEIFFLFEYLRELSLTTFLISEMPLDKSKYCEYEIEDFLADGIIVLDLAHHQRKVIREIQIVKMRATDCSNDVFSLEYKNRKFMALYGGETPLL